MIHYDGQTDRQMRATLAAAQAFNPRNYDDAEYALAHPSEFDAATLAMCERTVDAFWEVAR